MIKREKNKLKGANKMEFRKIKIRLISEDGVDVSYYSEHKGDTFSALKLTKQIIEVLSSDKFNNLDNNLTKAIKTFETIGGTLSEKDYNYIKKYYKSKISKDLNFGKINDKDGFIAIRPFDNINYNYHGEDSDITIFHDINNDFRINLNIFPELNPEYLNESDRSEALIYMNPFGNNINNFYALSIEDFNKIYSAVFDENRNWFIFTLDNVQEGFDYYYINDGYRIIFYY